MEEMPLSYTVERTKSELRELGLSEEQINKYSFKGIEEPLPKEYGGPFCVFGDYYKDKEDKYHYICYCPGCKKLSLTDRCACMCGTCRKCGYRWSCMPPLDLKQFIPKFNLQEIIVAQPFKPEDYKDYII